MSWSHDSYVQLELDNKPRYPNIMGCGVEMMHPGDTSHLYFFEANQYLWVVSVQIRILHFVCSTLLVLTRWSRCNFQTEFHVKIL